MQMKTRTMTTPFDKPCAPLSGPVLWVLLTTATLAFSPLAHAVGLGNHQVRSALGQPLKVAIDVVSATKSGIATSCFNVLRDTSSSEGIPFVTQGSLSVEGKGKNSRLVFTASRPTNDPVVKLAIETICGQRARREYTIMLDPQQTTDGKEIPLPPAPGASVPSAAPASPSANSTFAPQSIPAASTTVNKVPATTNIAPVGIPKSTSSGGPAPVNSTEAAFSGLPGSLTSTELESYEKAIQQNKPSKNGASGSKKSQAKDGDAANTDTEKKKSTEDLNNVVSDAPSTNRKARHNTEDSGDVRLSISDGEQGTITSKNIQPKLSMITELSPIESPSGGLSDTGVKLTPEERAAILAKVERVINAPLEHDLAKSDLPSLDESTKNTDTASSYERYIKQRTTDELEKKLAEASAAKRNYRIAIVFGGASLLLLGLWWRKRNVERSQGYGSTDSDQKKKLNEKHQDPQVWSDDTLSKDEYPGVKTHTVTYEYAHDAKPSSASEHSIEHTSVTQHHEEAESHAAEEHAEPTGSTPPTFVSAFSEPEPDTAKSTDIKDADPILEHPSNAQVSSHSDKAAAHQPDNTFEQPLHAPLDFSTHTQSGLAIDPFAGPAASTKNQNEEESSPFPAIETAGPHTDQPLDDIVLHDPLLNPVIATHSHAETLSSPPVPHHTHLDPAAVPTFDLPIMDKIDHVERELLHANNSNGGILVQGQTVVDQATQYLHAEQHDVARSYLESSIEWLPAAPQPWLMLLRLHATQHGDSTVFSSLQHRFLNFFKGIEPFSLDDLLKQPEISQHDHHHSALERCSPLLLSQIMNDWNDNERVKQQLENILVNGLQSSAERFTIDAVQELLFLYNLISLKTTKK